MGRKTQEIKKIIKIKKKIKYEKTQKEKKGIREGKQRVSKIVIVGVGPKDLGTPAYFISSPRPMPRRKKCPRTNKGNPDCRDILQMTTLSSADQNHGKGKRHVTRGSPLKHPKGSSEPNGPTIRAWQKNNSRRNCHLRIKYPQLTP